VLFSATSIFRADICSFCDMKMVKRELLCYNSPQSLTNCVFLPWRNIRTSLLFTAVIFAGFDGASGGRVSRESDKSNSDARSPDAWHSYQLATAMPRRIICRMPARMVLFAKVH
jgi:hypothetical protein